MVEVTIIFITTSKCDQIVKNSENNNSRILECFGNCTSIYLLKEGSVYRTLSETVYRCGSFEEKAKQIISKTPFKVKAVISTYGMSYIVIVEDLYINWNLTLFGRNDISGWNKIPIDLFNRIPNIEDKSIIERFLHLYRSNMCFLVK